MRAGGAAGQMDAGGEGDTSRGEKHMHGQHKQVDARSITSRIARQLGFFGRVHQRSVIRQTRSDAQLGLAKFFRTSATVNIHRTVFVFTMRITTFSFIWSHCRPADIFALTGVC